MLVALEIDEYSHWRHAIRARPLAVSEGDWTLLAAIVPCTSRGGRSLHSMLFSQGVDQCQLVDQLSFVIL